MKDVPLGQSILIFQVQWSDDLAGKPRWLVLNKIDRLQKENVEEHCQAIVDELKWKGPVYRISALKGDGARGLMFAIMDFLELLRQQDSFPADVSHR